LIKKTPSIFDDMPKDLTAESFATLAQKGDVKIERIVSQGHSSPESGWYDQTQDEWVIVLQGEAIISFEDDENVHLGIGDHILISAHTKHKVSWTTPKIETIWIAVHF